MAAVLLGHRGLRPQHPPQIGVHIGGPVLRRRGQQRGRGGDPGEHQQRVHPAVEGALDVRIQPVPDHQRPLRAGPQHGLPVHRRQRLARHLGRAARGDPYDLHQRAVAGGDPALLGDGQIGVGREPRHPALHRVGRLREPCPVQGRVIALHHGRRIVVRRVDGHQPALAQRHPQPLAPDRQHPRTGRHLLGDQPRHRLRRGDHLVRRGRQPEAGELSGDRLRGAGRVIGHIRQMHPAVPRRRQRLHGVRDGLPAGVDDPVQIQQRGVVRLAQRTPASVGPPAHLLVHAASLLVAVRRPPSVRRASHRLRPGAAFRSPGDRFVQPVFRPNFPATYRLYPDLPSARNRHSILQ